MKQTYRKYLSLKFLCTLKLQSKYLRQELPKSLYMSLTILGDGFIIINCIWGWIKNNNLRLTKVFTK